MSSYELTVVLAGNVSSAKKKSIKSKIEEASGKTNVTNFDDWGKKDLEYEIKKNTSGVFLHFLLKLDPNKVKDIDTKLNLEEDVIRYLLVRKDE